MHNFKNSFQFFESWFFSLPLLVEFSDNLSKLIIIDRFWEHFALETALTNLKKQSFFQFCYIIYSWIFFLTNIANHFLRCSFNKSLYVLLWREVDDAPVLQERVDSYNTADITRKVFTANGRWQVFLWVFSPHWYHEVSVKFVKKGCFFEKFVGVIFLQKEFRKGFLLNIVNFVDVKPFGKGGQSNVEGRLNNGTIWSNVYVVSLLVGILVWVEVGWIRNVDVHLKTALVILLKLKGLKDSLGITLYPELTFLRPIVSSGLFGFFLNILNFVNQN